MIKVLQHAPAKSTFLVNRALGLTQDTFEANHIKPPIDASRLSGEESSRSNGSVKDTFVVKIDKGIGGLGLSLAGGAGSPAEFKGIAIVRMTSVT